MVDQVFNTALGAVKRYVEKVNTEDPAASLLRMHAWVITAVDDDINNQDTIAELEALALSTEATNTNYADQSWEAADITITVDDTANDVDIDSTDVTFSTILAGSNWTHVTICYDDTGSDADAVLMLLTVHVFSVTPNGGDITAQFAADGWYKAS